MSSILVSTRRKASLYWRDFKSLGFHFPVIGLAAVVGIFYNRLPAEIQHVFLALCAVYLVHLFAEFVPMRRLLRLLDKDSLLKACGTHGITAIYDSRDRVWTELAVGDHCLLAEHPKHVWALGISLSADSFCLEDFLKRFAQRKPSDLKILLLDALSSTALFRDLIESARADAVRMIQHGRNADSPYYAHNIYKKFHEDLDTFTSRALGQPFLQAVRFYRHTPICWMIRVDDVVFFQPYTFGSSRETDEFQTIGSEMPIFRIDRKRGDKTFRVLLDHFNKLWSTSDGSVYAVADRRKRRDRILEAIFDQRGDWLRSVCDTFYKTKLVDGARRDQRTEARRSGTSICGSMEVTWNGTVATGLIADYTHDAFALWVDETKACPSEGQKVHTRCITQIAANSLDDEIAQQYIQRFSDRDFEVRRIDAPKKNGGIRGSFKRVFLRLPAA